jgi:hypothetical protein
MVKLKVPSMAFVVKLNSERFIRHYENRENRVGDRISINIKLRVEHVIVKGERITGAHYS